MSQHTRPPQGSTSSAMSETGRAPDESITSTFPPSLTCTDPKGTTYRQSCGHYLPRAIPLNEDSSTTTTDEVGTGRPIGKAEISFDQGSSALFLYLDPKEGLTTCQSILHLDMSLEPKHFDANRQSFLVLFAYYNGDKDLPNALIASLAEVDSWVDAVAKMQSVDDRSLLQSKLSVNPLTSVIKKMKLDFPVSGIYYVNAEDLALLTRAISNAEGWGAKTRLDLSSEYSTVIPPHLFRYLSANSTGTARNRPSETYGVLDIESDRRTAAIDIGRSFLARPCDAAGVRSLPQKVLDAYLGNGGYAEMMREATRRGITAYHRENTASSSPTYSYHPEQPMTLARTRYEQIGRDEAARLEDFVLVSCQAALDDVFQCSSGVSDPGSMCQPLRLVNKNRYNSRAHWDRKADGSNLTGFLDEDHLLESTVPVPRAERITEWIRFEDKLTAKKRQAQVSAEMRRLQEAERKTEYYRSKSDAAERRLQYMHTKLSEQADRSSRRMLEFAVATLAPPSKASEGSSAGDELDRY